MRARASICVLLALLVSGCGGTRERLDKQQQEIDELTRMVNWLGQDVKSAHHECADLEYKVRSLEKHVHDRANHAFHIEYDVIQFIERERLRVDRIEKCHRIPRLPWICCGQSRPGEPQINHEEFQLPSFYPEYDPPSDAPPAPAEATE